MLHCLFKKFERLITYICFVFFFFHRKNESKRKRNIAADVLGEAMPPTQQFFGGMAQNQTSFDGQSFRNQVAYAFKNRSMANSMQSAMGQQYQHGGMGGCMDGMGGMGGVPAMGGMQPMYGGMMGSMNWAPSFCMNYDCDDNKKRKKANKKVVDIDLSQEENTSSNVSDDEE